MFESHLDPKCTLLRAERVLEVRKRGEPHTPQNERTYSSGVKTPGRCGIPRTRTPFLDNNYAR